MLEMSEPHAAPLPPTDSLPLSVWVSGANAHANFADFFQEIRVVMA